MPVWVYTSPPDQLLSNITHDGLDLHPATNVANVKRAQGEVPWSGSDCKAIKQGNTQAAPKKQCQRRSPMRSDEYESVSIVMICRTADGMVKQLEANDEKPSCLSE